MPSSVVRRRSGGSVVAILSAPQREGTNIVRRISPGTVTVFVIAILAGLLGAFVVKRIMLQRVDQEVETEEMVVVSRVNLSDTQQISRRMLELRPVRPGESADGAISSTDVAVGRHVRQVIPAQTPITEDVLYKIGENPIKQLVERISDGMRAITIQVTGLIHGSMLIRHDTDVDISLTVETDHPDVKEIALKGIGTKTLLRNIRVLAVVNPPGRPRNSALLNSLTSIVVEVTPDQANTLALAQEIGSLSVSVVGRGDSGPGARDEVVKPNDLLGLVHPTPLAPPPPSLPLPPLPPDEPEENFQVEHYRGGEMYRQTFGPEQINEAQSGNSDKTVRPRFRSSSVPRTNRSQSTITSQDAANSQSTPTAAGNESPHQRTSNAQPVPDQGQLHQPVADATPQEPPQQFETGDVVAVENKSSYVTDLDQLPSSYEVPNSYVSDSGLLPGFNEQPSSYVNRALESYVEVGPVSASATPSDENSQRVQPADESPAGQKVTAQKTEPPHSDQPQPVVTHRDLNHQQSIRTVPQQSANRRVAPARKVRAPDPEAGLTERVYMSVRSNQKKSLYSRFEN